MMVMSVNAQSEVIETQETYCMIVATQNFMSSKCSITIDYGQSTKLIDGSSKMKLVDENGKKDIEEAVSIKGKLERYGKIDELIAKMCDMVSALEYPNENLMKCWEVFKKKIISSQTRNNLEGSTTISTSK